MPTIANRLSDKVVLRTWFFVDIKEKWSGSWQLARYLSPVQCAFRASEIGDAVFEYDFGKIKREDTLQVATYPPAELRNWYVRIRIQRPGFNPEPIWCGVFIDDERSFDRDTIQTGKQTLRAKDLAYLFDRQPLSVSYVERNPKDDTDNELSWSDVYRINRLLAFNERDKFGQGKVSGTELDGNRSTARSEAGAHVFSSDGVVWTNKDILDYLLTFFVPKKGPQVLVTGKRAALRHIKRVHRFDGKTLFGALQDIMRKDEGFAFRFDYIPNSSGANEFVGLHINTVVDEEVRYGNVIIEPNTERTRITFPSVPPYSHMIDKTPYRVTSANEYDEIIVRGSPIKVCATFAMKELDKSFSLVKGWPDQLQQAYLVDADPIDPFVSDDARASDRFDGVFTRFVVDKNWNHKSSNGSSCSPKCEDDGSLQFNERSRYFNDTRRFLSRTPFKEGWDYAMDPPVAPLDPPADPEFRPFMVVYSDEEDGEIHTASQRWMFVDKLAYADEDLRNCSVRVLDKAFGFELVVMPRHYFAHGIFLSDNTEQFPELKYKYLAATGFFEIDEPFQIKLTKLEGDQEHEAKRTLVISVQDAEAWVVVDGTVWDVDANGDPKLIAGSRALRYDIDKLRSIAAAAKAWYRKKRQAVVITIRQLGSFLPLLTMVESISTTSGTQSIATVVSAKVLDFRSMTTTIETGWNNADFIPDFTGKDAF